MLWPPHRATRESSILRKLAYPDRCKGLLGQSATDLTRTNCEHSPHCHLDTGFDLKLRLEAFCIYHKILNMQPISLEKVLLKPTFHQQFQDNFISLSCFQRQNYYKKHPPYTSHYFKGNPKSIHLRKLTFLYPQHSSLTFSQNTPD